MVRWSHGSGAALDAFALLAHHPSGSCAVVVVRRGAPLDVGSRLVLPDGAVGLFRDDDGGVLVADPAGKVWELSDPWGPERERWRTQELGFTLFGVVGHGARRVVHGARTSDGASVLAERDGHAGEWRPIPGPGFRPASVATGPGGIWVVGEDAVGHWDGEGWHVLEGVGPHTAVAVGDEVLVGARDGTVSVGGLGGFRPLGQGPAVPLCLAAWQGDVWVGSASGLYTLARGVVREGRHVSHLDGRGELVATTPDLVMASADGQKFAGGLRGVGDGLPWPGGP